MSKRAQNGSYQLPFLTSHKRFYVKKALFKGSPFDKIYFVILTLKQVKSSVGSFSILLRKLFIKAKDYSL